MCQHRDERAVQADHRAGVAGAARAAAGFGGGTAAAVSGRRGSDMRRGSGPDARKRGGNGAEVWQDALAHDLDQH
eukprot:184596-Chlamydomonas_euryale.AAC.1